MAENSEELESAAQETLDQASPAAVALALGRTSKGGKALDTEATAFLRDQRRLINLQAEHLHEQRELQTSRLRWGRFSDRMKALLQVITALVGLAVVAAIAVMAWQAHEDKSLVVQGFSAPPSFAARGYTGQVLAEDLMGRVSAIRAKAYAGSLSDVAQVRADQSDTLKVDIPGTGVSIDDAERFLHRWLGSQTPVTGDLRDEGDGQVSISLHVAGADPITVKGPATDLDALMQAAAEKAFASFDPENAVIYLYGIGRQADAVAAAEHNARVAPTLLERANAYSLWGYIDGDKRRSLARALVGIRLDPKSANGWRGAGDASLQLGHDQAAVDFYRRVLQSRIDDQLLRQRSQFTWLMGHATAAINRATGDFGELHGDLSIDRDTTLADGFAMSALEAGALHDPDGFRRNLAAALAAGPGDRLSEEFGSEARWYASSGAEDWPRALSDARALVAREEGLKAVAPSPDWVGAAELLLATRYRPWLAYAEAMTGELASARALIEATPLDCYLCVRMRGRIAAAARDGAGAERWFAEAVRQAPRLPMAYGEWGQMRLANGDIAGAIGKFELAHRTGPRWADPLELWGEALMRQGDDAGAAARFAEAGVQAPRWGRNHLRWGEALLLSGRYREARAQLETANALDLNAPDRAALAVFLARTAKGPLHG